MDEGEWIENVVILLRTLKEHGDFYHSCIELDVYRGGVSGDRLEVEVTALLDNLPVEPEYELRRG